MDLDDLPTGRVLTRRETLAVLGSAGTLLVLGGSLSGASASRASRPGNPCVVRPAGTAGPYYVDEKLERSDIRGDPTDNSVREGALLGLTLNVSSLTKGECAPLVGAIVDLWQCDAHGVYSDAEDATFNTIGKKFLRGHQITDRSGVVRFITIYPGWYPSRTPHLHFKIRSPAKAISAYEFIGQLYFDEGVTDRVYAQPPYAARGKRTVSNITDGIYNRQGGRQTMLKVTPAGNGYAATFDLAIDHS